MHHRRRVQCYTQDLPVEYRKFRLEGFPGEFRVFRWTEVLHSYCVLVPLRSSFPALETWCAFRPVLFAASFSRSQCSSALISLTICPLTSSIRSVQDSVECSPLNLESL